MLTDEEEQILKNLEEMEAQKVPIMVWQWAAITKLKNAKEPVPKGMAPDDFNAFHRLNIKQGVHLIKLTPEEAAELERLKTILWQCIEEQEDYMENVDSWDIPIRFRKG
jgi:hypothetical protein